MNLKMVYEKVSLVVPIEERRFLNYFCDTINELLSMYGKYVIKEDAIFNPPEKITDDTPVLPLYTGAIVDNIIFLSGGKDIYKSEFIRKSKDAYLNYWNKDAKGRRIKRREW